MFTFSSPRWRRPGSCLLIVAALLASSCGTGTTPEVETVAFEAPIETEDEATTPVATPTSTVTPTEAPTVEPCEIERVTDEYGFEVEISSCDTTSEATQTSFLTVDEFIGSPAARTLLAGIQDRLMLQSGCTSIDLGGTELTSGPAVRDAVLAIPDAAVVEAITNLFATLSAADDVCDDLSAWVPATRSVLADMQQLEELVAPEPGVLLPSRDGELDDITLLTADAAAHYDRLYFALAGLQPVQGSPFWYSSRHLVNILGLRDLVAVDKEPDVITVGSSVVARGIDPLAMTDALGITVMNAAMARSTTPIHARAIDQVLTISPAPKTIIWSELSHRYFRGDCTIPELPDIEIPLALQARLFQGLPAIGDVEPLDLYFGSDPIAPTYDNTPVLTHSVEEGTWRLGYTPPQGGAPDSAALTEIAERLHADPYVNPVICDAQFDDLLAAITRWTDAGHSVVMVAAPISDELAALHPLGRFGHDEFNAQLQFAVEAKGATFLDVSDILGAGEFADPTHPNEAGRAVFTAALIDFLANQ